MANCAVDSSVLNVKALVEAFNQNLREGSFEALTLGTAVSRKMDDLPMWLQYYPKILFDTINRSGTGVITKAATHSTAPTL